MMFDAEQKAENIQDSTVNQAKRDIHIHNGMTYSEVKDVCETTVRTEVERLTSDAKKEIMAILEAFQKEFYDRLEALENKERIEKLKKPAMQLCIHKTIMETVGTEDEEKRKELMDLLIDRLNVEEESTERVVIEDAIEKAAKLSKPLKALLAALLLRSVIHPEPFMMNHTFQKYGDMFRDLGQLTGLDIAFGRQMQCIYPMSGLLTSYSYEDILLKNYDLLFRHRGTFGQFKEFAESHPCINRGINLFGLDNMRIISFDGTKNPEMTDDTEYFFITSSSEVLKKMFMAQRCMDMVQALDELMATQQPFTHDEVRQYLHDINDGWDYLFSTFQRRDVVPLLLSPVGNYLAMGYTKVMGRQPDNFLAELYKHNQGW